MSVLDAIHRALAPWMILILAFNCWCWYKYGQLRERYRKEDEREQQYRRDEMFEP